MGGKGKGEVWEVIKGGRAKGLHRLDESISPAPPPASSASLSDSGILEPYRQKRRQRTLESADLDLDLPPVLVGTNGSQIEMEKNNVASLIANVAVKFATLFTFISYPHTNLCAHPTVPYCTRWVHCAHYTLS